MEKEELVKAFNLKSDKKPKRVLEKRNKYLILGISLLVIILILIITLTHYQRCDSLECVNKNLEKCKKTVFAGGQGMIFGYVIEGKVDDSCIVDVELLQGELNNQDSLILEGKSMRCSIPKSVVILPESDLSYCHGELKEALQEQVIKQLHGYLVKNLGQINGDILNPLSLIEEDN